MPRPRFEKLDAPRRAAILSAAAEEFAEHGFERASYNRIIERSGLSKGAMYYYFDDKEDLYVTVLKDAVTRIILELGEIRQTPDAAAFWEEFQALYRRCLLMFQNNPTVLGLGRSLIKTMAHGNSSALNEIRQVARGFMEDMIRGGQAVKAIRDDLPDGLLMSVLMALEEGIDLWLADQLGDLSLAQIEQMSALLTKLYQRVAMPEEKP